MNTPVSFETINSCPYDPGSKILWTLKFRNMEAITVLLNKERADFQTKTLFARWSVVAVSSSVICMTDVTQLASQSRWRQQKQLCCESIM